MSKDVADVLRGAREKIAVPERWTRLVLARDADGRGVSPNDSTAVCWCGYGAVETATLDMGLCCSAETALDMAAARQSRFGCSFSLMQDFPTTTHADVLACFDRAIAAEDAAP